MKQMRSRFRLITLLLVCAFLIVLALCTGSVLKSAGITLPSLSSLPLIGATASPDSFVSPAPSVSPDFSPVPSGSPSSGPSFPGTDNSPVPEYNIFGL